VGVGTRSSPGRYRAFARCYKPGTRRWLCRRRIERQRSAWRICSRVWGRVVLRTEYCPQRGIGATQLEKQCAAGSGLGLNNRAAAHVSDFSVP